jgi:hypothetical protein
MLRSELEQQSVNVSSMSLIGSGTNTVAVRNKLESLSSRVVIALAGANDFLDFASIFVFVR